MTDYEGFKQLEVIRISELTRATDNNTTLVISAYMFSLDTLTAITLFNPNRPNIVHRHNVKIKFAKCVALKGQADIILQSLAKTRVGNADLGSVLPSE
ncbi:unnamed protein product [Oppiella nova]|uniref:Uncharacterized protein n=1 Tax=Oppiella nova TaxID=334625 RepID=A0A7R9LY67_9ACAR|nr:unnamed protein product [Oppiella nova]CAG2168142.1 unnamed protein product [Oppiella nova]